jgi:hypothetical protein
MGTRGNYIFRYKGKYYVFYNHWDSYFDGLGDLIVKELRSWTAADFDNAKKLLEGFGVLEKNNGGDNNESLMKALTNPTKYCLNGGKNFEGLMKTLNNPTQYCLDDINDDAKRGLDCEYVYILDFDRNLFICRWDSDTKMQAYRLTDIPEHWMDLLAVDEE